MSIDAFSVLGIDARESVTDRELKQAYAVRLKSINADEDRDSFIVLRQAYEQVRNEINARRYFEEVNAPAMAENVELSERLPQNLAPFQEAPVPVDVRETPALSAMNAVKMLVADPRKWQKPDSWLAILDGDHLQEIDEIHEFEARLRAYICEQSGFGELSRPLAKPWMLKRSLSFLDERFGWTRNNGLNFWERQQFDWLRALIDPESAPIYRMPAAAQPEPQMVTELKGNTGGRPWYNHPIARVLWIWLCFQLILKVVSSLGL